MIDFKDVTLADKDIIQAFTLKSWRQNCELSFVNIYTWKFEYRTEYAILNDFLLIRFVLNNELKYMMPMGNGDVKPIVEAIMADAQEQGKPFSMRGACQNLCKVIEDAMPNAFIYKHDRDYSDYVYLREDLTTLKGKKLQPKRNFINRFIKNNSNFEYKVLTPDLIAECLELEQEWLGNHNNTTPQEKYALKAERTALTTALNNMEALDLLGGVLYVDDKIVAFTYGAPINNNTFDVCIEKADRNVEGAYAMINNLFAKHIPEEYTYINREEDLGMPGLRQTKLSYNPVHLIEKHEVELK